MRLHHRLPALRAIALARAAHAERASRADRWSLQEAFSEDLEEVETAVSEAALDALLEEIHARRCQMIEETPLRSESASAAPFAAGDRFGIHSLGRSLATGEAEIASRGFFDALDRPPVEYWLECVRHPTARRDEGAGVGVLFFVPAACAALAEAGCAACPSGALTLVDPRQTALYGQLAQRVD